MFDPSCFVLDTRYGYVVRHEGADYYRCSHVPLRVRLNPLRLTIGIGRGRPCPIVLNKGAWMHRRVSDFLFRIKRGDASTRKQQELPPVPNPPVRHGAHCGCHFEGINGKWVPCHRHQDQPDPRI